ncbi:MAG: tRNA (guanosine(37)-N1)-methyltransferase TrmD [Alphaproteobacteria bacterium]
MSAWHINLLTLFPEMFPGTLGASLSKKALEKGLWSYNAINIRNFAPDKHKSVDDTPFGGGAGMVLRADTIENALSSIKNPGKLIYLSPRGRVLDQKMIRDLVKIPIITLLCGRYEGVDQRILDAYEFEEVSIGDYVLSGGEPAALVLMDACIRLLDGVMGNEETAGEESFEGGLLEYPHYTRPATWMARDGQPYSVPDVLQSGNHAETARWRRAQSEALTQQRRPDLLKK